MGSIRTGLGVALVLSFSPTAVSRGVAVGPPLTPATAQAALLDLAFDPSMNGFRPEPFPGELWVWHSEFLDTIQGPDAISATCGPVTASRREGCLRIGPFDCDLRDRTVEFGTEYGAGDERYRGVFVRGPSGRWTVRIVDSWFTGW
jgi:hypothetical protein